MIISCTSIMMRELGGDTSLYDRTIATCFKEVYSTFMDYDKKALREIVNADGTPCETPEGRTINPGHSIETSWFTLEEAKHQKDDKLLKNGLQVLDWALDWGWDTVQGDGGIIYFRNVDEAEGHEPDQYEHELKLWWPQNEAIYGTPSCTMKGTRWAGAFHYPRMLFNLIRLMQEELAK